MYHISQRVMFHLFALYLWQIVGYVMDRVSAMLSEAMLISLCGGGVVSYMTDQILQTTCVFPSHVHQKKNLASIIIAPQGELPKIPPFLICQKWSSLFPWLAKICLVILNHTGFHWLQDQDKCLSYLFMSLEMILQLSNAGTWLQTPVLCWLWVRDSPK